MIWETISIPKPSTELFKRHYLSCNFIFPIFTSVRNYPKNCLKKSFPYIIHGELNRSASSALRTQVFMYRMWSHFACWGRQWPSFKCEIYQFPQYVESRSNSLQASKEEKMVKCENRWTNGLNQNKSRQMFSNQVLHGLQLLEFISKSVWHYFSPFAGYQASQSVCRSKLRIIFSCK